MQLRRQFLRNLAVFSGMSPFSQLHAESLETLAKSSPRARFWTSIPLAGNDCRLCHESGPNQKGKIHKHKKEYVRCLLCAQNCVLSPGERGRCRARMNVDGELRSLVYGRPITIQIDPIEKKPFFHFLPGSNAYSLATSGCPLHCRFCQNWEISQSSPEDYSSVRIPPREIAQNCLHKNSPIIAFTYNEPTVFTEYMMDIASEAKPHGIRSVLISCGYMNSDPLKELCKVLDGIKIDLKGFHPDFYRNICSAELQPVLNTIKQIARSGIHLEIVNLVVPTLNDSEKMLRDLIHWILDETGPNVPVHFTRFHPAFQMQNLAPTPVATLERAWEMARTAGIRYAYVGNVPGHRGNHTWCPQCHKVVIRRKGFFLEEMNVKQGKCTFCSQSIAGVWA